MMNDRAMMIYAVSAILEFPEGFHSGKGGKKSNFLELSRDGQGNPVLRGTSLAGVLRHAMSKNLSQNEVEEYFGCPLGTRTISHIPESRKERQESRVVFEDAPFLQTENKSDETTHNLICRHTGAVSQENKGLFSLERVPAGSSCKLFFYIRGEKGYEQADGDFAKTLANTLNENTLGGSANRGCGRCVLKDGSFKFQAFDLSNSQDAAAFLDILYGNQRELPENADTINATSAKECFALKLHLSIPKGQDILCSMGNDMYPVTSVTFDGEEYWKLPGSSFRGIFRAWMTRLAARAGKQLLQSVERYLEVNDEKVVARNNSEDAFIDVISELFGSLSNKGRIHFSDALAQVPINPSRDTQRRAHVVIDRFTAGTNDGKLFENHVLTSASNADFSMVISIDSPKQEELDWLAQTLKALHLGLIRIGSSKSAGRLAVSSSEVTQIPDGVSFNLQLNA